MYDILKLTGNSVDEYFREQKSRMIRYTRNHDWHTPRRLPWLTYCDECGLAWKKKKNVQKSIKKGCVFYRLKEKG